VFDLNDQHDAVGGCATVTEPAHRDEDREAAAMRWLRGEFPGWDVTLDSTAGWEGDHRPLWIAQRDGHHPQAELSAAKLHSRLTDYLQRESRRGSYKN
jgi:hypothetical protein